MSIATLAACGSDGSDGARGPQGEPGAPGQDVDPATLDNLTAQITALTQAVNPEQCSLCHAGDSPIARSGSMHQASYKELYQDGVMVVTPASMNFSVAGTTATLTFKLTKNGAPFDCTKSTAAFPASDFLIGSYWAQYDVATKTFPSDVSLAATKAWDSVTNTCTFTKTGLTATQATNMAGPGIVTIYGTDEIQDLDGGIRKGKYPFAGILKVGAVDYSTAANVTGCENCHTQPFLKHGYIYGTVTENATGAATEFYTCKGCHYDTRTGHDLNWQIEKDLKDLIATTTDATVKAAAEARLAELIAGADPTAAEDAKYAYVAKLMNDVHMSHAMEFAYPQSMKNCITCHAGKLTTVLAAANFKAETCISCHSIDGLIAKMTAADLGFKHTNQTADLATLRTTVCTVCHDGASAPSFSTIHGGGYDPKIYSTTGVRYSDTFLVSIDSASVDANNILDVKFSATGTLGSLSAASIKPTLLIGLYGYNTKDFLVAAHGTAPASAGGGRNLEFVVDPAGTANPRFTIVSAAGGSWEVKADLSLWADKIAAGTIKRAEIAVMPELKDASGLVLGLNAPSKTFNLAANAFEDFFSDIVKVAKTTGTDGSVTGCNTCHDQLATTFHSGIRGGNIKVCRICHEVSSPGSHLELESRSIDSYAHAIHTFQAFDIGDVDFADALEGAEYVHHITTSFPRFGIENCESCHNAGMYDVPNQSKSMPGVLSGTDVVDARDIGTIPPLVTGPAVRACGGCHRAQAVNADDADKLAALLSHWKTFGYAVDATTDRQALWESIVAKIMALFN